MMKLNVEIHPFGIEEHKYSIRNLYIANSTKKKNGKTLYNVWLEDPRESDKLRPEPFCTVWHKREEMDLVLISKVSTKVWKTLNE